MKLLSALILTFLLSTGSVLSLQETEALLGAERYLEVVVGRLLDEGLNSRTIFHRKAMEGFEATQKLIEKYTPEQYKLARLNGMKDDNAEYQSILNEVGFHAPLVELPERSGVQKILTLFLSANQDSSCKESIEELKSSVLGLKGEGSFDKVNLLVSILNENC